MEDGYDMQGAESADDSSSVRYSKNFSSFKTNVMQVYTTNKTEPLKKSHKFLYDDTRISHDNAALRDGAYEHCVWVIYQQL